MSETTFVVIIETNINLTKRQETHMLDCITEAMEEEIDNSIRYAGLELKIRVGKPKKVS